MKLWVIYAFNLLFLVHKVSASTEIPLTPIAEILNTPEGSPSLSNIASITEPPRSLEGANLSYDVSLENPNDREIRCIGTIFTAYLGDIDDRCQTSDFSRSIDLSSGQGFLDFKPFETREFFGIGNSSREERSRRAGKDLEFCRRDELQLKCGFTCTNNRKYNETWDEKIIGGSKKYRCEANGESRRTSDPVVCETDFKADLANDRCLKKCDDIHLPGDTWETTIDNGKILNVCLSSGQISKTFTCISSPLHVESGNSCVPASCGGARHGERYRTRSIDLGYFEATCFFGQLANEELICDSGAIKENGSCRKGRSCEGYSHGSTYTTSKTKKCGRSLTTTINKSCNDGSILVLSEQTVDLGHHTPCSRDGIPL